MQEFPCFHAFPSIPVLTWVAHKYPCWLADVGLSCPIYCNTFTACSKANAGCYVHNLCPTKAVHLDFLLFHLRFPHYLHIDSVNIDIADVQWCELSLFVIRPWQPHWTQCCVVSDCRRAREGAPEAAGGEGADQRCPKESKRGAGTQDLQSRCWEIHQPCHNVRTQSHTRLLTYCLFYTLCNTYIFIFVPYVKAAEWIQTTEI